MATEYEIAARWKKSVVIASHLYAHGLRSDELPKISREEWSKLAARLDQKHPSVQTIEVVGEVLRVLELAVARKIQEEKAK